MLNAQIPGVNLGQALMAPKISIKVIFDSFYQSNAIHDMICHLYAIKMLKVLNLSKNFDNSKI